MVGKKYILGPQGKYVGNPVGVTKTLSCYMGPLGFSHRKASAGHSGGLHCSTQVRMPAVKRLEVWAPNMGP